MCGFACELRVGELADVKAVARMAATMDDRGPDCSGTWASGSLVLSFLLARRGVHRPAGLRAPGHRLRHARRPHEGGEPRHPCRKLLRRREFQRHLGSRGLGRTDVRFCL